MFYENQKWLGFNFRCDMTFQNVDIVQSLVRDLECDRNGPGTALQLITKTLSDIRKLQSASVTKESKVNFLNRGIKREVIFERDDNIESMVVSLLDKKFCDKAMIMKFGFDTYKKSMEMEVKRLKKEMEFLNSVAAKKRRILRSVSNDDVFKRCANYLDSMRSADLIRTGKENETLWKCALDLGELQVSAFDKWMSVVSMIASDLPWDDCLDVSGKMSFVRLGSISIDAVLKPKGKDVSCDPVSIEEMSASEICVETRNVSKETRSRVDGNGFKENDNVDENDDVEEGKMEKGTVDTGKEKGKDEKGKNEPGKIALRDSKNLKRKPYDKPERSYNESVNRYDARARNSYSVRYDYDGYNDCEGNGNGNNYCGNYRNFYDDAGQVSSNNARNGYGNYRGPSGYGRRY